MRTTVIYAMGVIWGQLSEPGLSSDSCLCRRALCSNKAVGRSKGLVEIQNGNLGRLDIRAISAICAFSIDVLVAPKRVPCWGSRAAGPKVAIPAEGHNLQRFALMTKFVWGLCKDKLNLSKRL